MESDCDKTINYLLALFFSLRTWAFIFNIGKWCTHTTWWSGNLSCSSKLTVHSVSYNLCLSGLDRSSWLAMSCLRCSFASCLLFLRFSVTDFIVCRSFALECSSDTLKSFPGHPCTGTATSFISVSFLQQAFVYTASRTCPSAWSARRGLLVTPSTTLADFQQKLGKETVHHGEGRPCPDDLWGPSGTGLQVRLATP